MLGLMLLALAASGWNALAATALCPHAGGNAQKAVMARNMSAGHAGGALRPEAASKPDCHDSAMEHDMKGGAVTVDAMPGSSEDSARLGLPYESTCTHCMNRTEVSTSTSMARRVEPKRSLKTAAAKTVSLALPVRAFSQPVLYRQGAPPGSPIPKHLLISLLLI